MDRQCLYRAIGCLLLVVAAVGCGDGGPASPTIQATPTPAPTRTTIVQGGFDLPANWHKGLWFTTTRAGNLDITVDWTYSDSEIWVYIGQGACTESQVQAGQCSYIFQSRVAPPKPAVLTFPNLAAGGYTLLISNVSMRAESVAFVVGLTP